MPEFVGLVIVDVTAGGTGLLGLGCGRGTCIEMQGKYVNQSKHHFKMIVFKATKFAWLFKKRS